MSLLITSLSALLSAGTPPAVTVQVIPVPKSQCAAVAAELKTHLLLLEQASLRAKKKELEASLASSSAQMPSDREVFDPASITFSCVSN